MFDATLTTATIQSRLKCPSTHTNGVVHVKFDNGIYAQIGVRGVIVTKGVGKYNLHLQVQSNIAKLLQVKASSPTLLNVTGRFCHVLRAPLTKTIGFLEERVGGVAYVPEISSSITFRVLKVDCQLQRSGKILYTTKSMYQLLLAHVKLKKLLSMIN